MRGAYVNNAETEEVPATAPVSAAIAKPRNGASATTIKLARRLGLRHVSSDVLSIRRRRCGKGWTYLAPDGRTIRDRAIVRRLARLAVPPAYADVLYAEDPAAHLQAIGRDAAGRLQYRYHADWEKVREIRKAARLARLADVLPRIRRSVGQHLSAPEPTRESALAAVIELVACSAIRPGSESYARQHGTRGATTLLKSNVTLDGDADPADVSRQGRPESREGSRLPALVQGHRSAAPGPGPAAVPVPRRERQRARGQGAGGERVPAPDRRREYFAEGFPYADGVRQRARGARRAQRRPRANASAASRCSKPCAPLPRISTTRRRSAAAATCTIRWSLRSKTACSSGSRKRSPAAARRLGAPKCWRRSSPRRRA